ncbi:MAG: DNA primase [Rhizobiales bacterium]|nr:DNA primase [Hyphomicrobiales bacterium]
MAQRIPKDFINLLISRANIVDIIGSHLNLQKKGNDYWACCPFHNEKTASFSVSESKQFYYCFGCGAKGNVIDFLMEFLNLSYPEAIRNLANTLGMDVPESSEESKRYDEFKRLEEILISAQTLFVKSLKENEKAIDYLKQRGITGETAKVFGIGFAPNDYNTLKKQLNQYQESDMLSVGLLANSDNENYVKFRNRIMFPIYNTYGNLCGFGGRLLTENNKLPKYMNSPETKLYSKRNILYGLNIARKVKETEKRIFVVEGYMDVISLYQNDIKNVVATLGTAISQSHLLNCFKYSKEIIFAFDGDEAGQKAAWRSVEQLLPVIKDGYEASFYFLPDNLDPDSFVSKFGKDGWEKELKNKISLENFIFHKLSVDTNLESASGKATYITKVKNLLRDMKALVLKEMLEKDLFLRVGASSSSSASEIKKIYPNNEKKSSPMQKAVSIILNFPDIELDKRIFEEPILKKVPGFDILSEIFLLKNKVETISTGKILEHFRDTSSYKPLNKIASLDLPHLENPQSEFNGFIGVMYFTELEKKRDELVSLLQKADSSDEEANNEALSQIANIDKMLKKRKFL